MRKCALITGATSGLGLAYATWFAAKGYDLIITGRRKEVIEKRAEEIRNRYNSSVSVVLVDLAEEGGVKTLLGYLEGRDIHVLVNNAGFGFSTEFANTDIEGLKRLIYLQTSAVAEITHYVLKKMKTEGQGSIINISSDGAFAVVPKNVTYAAAKRFIVTFTEGLHMELKDTGIQVQVVCPGFVDTDFHENNGMPIEKTRKGMFAFRKPEEVVVESMKDFEKGRVICVPDRAGKIVKALADYMPRGMYYRFVGSFADKKLRKQK